MPLWIVSLLESLPESGAAQRWSQQSFEAFEKLQPPALINPLCLRTAALFSNRLQGFRPVTGAKIPHHPLKHQRAVLGKQSAMKRSDVFLLP